MRKDEERIYNSPNIVNLCIDSYDMEKQCGRLYHQYRENPLPFSSLFEAFKRMDELYDDLRYPESTTQTRSFLEKPRESGSRRLREEQEWLAELQRRGRRQVRQKVSFDSVTGQRGRDATFIVRVQYRQHSSWQGEVTWIDGKEKGWFGSVLELMEWVEGIMVYRSRKSYP